MNLCLSRTELSELTRSTRRRRQLEFLRANGIRHYVDAYGWPVVLRSAVEDTARQDDTGLPWKPNKVA